MTKLAGRKTRVAVGLLAVLVIAAGRSLTKGAEVTRMTTTGFVRSNDGTKIAFTKQGQGPALILVDGALCFRDNGPSADLIRLLSPHFTVYAYDRRGRGESGETGPYAIEREIEDLHAVIRQAGDSAFVFGSSSGAALAMEAVAAGLPIRKLVMFEPPIGVTQPGGPSLAEAQREVDRFVTAGDSARAARYFLTAMMGTPSAFASMMPVLMRGTWRKLKSVAHTIPYDLAILSDSAVLAGRANAITAPALVVGGAKSPEFMQKAVERVASSLPNARAMLLAGQGHDVAKAGETLAPIMTNFYKE